jgi:tyrosyl-tRNA synthetase
MIQYKYSFFVMLAYFFIKGTKMDIEEKLNLIKRNTQEIVTEEELRELLKTKENPSIYLGTAITGKPHVAYLLWVLKLADFLKAGFKVKLLLADVHGALDNCPWELLDKRYEYYSLVIPALFKAIGTDISNFEIVKGSQYQLNKDYVFDVYKASTIASIHDCKKASSEVVKTSDNPKLSGLLYPILQSLDEHYLDVDIQLGGVDQRKIFMFARENLPKLGYRSRIEIMTPLIPGLIGEKMSASDARTKIDLLDSHEEIKEKLKKAHCPEGIVEGNGVLSFIKHILMYIKEEKNESFTINRPEKWGGNLTYKTYLELEKDFIAKQVHPLDIKMALAEDINTLLEPVRVATQGKEELIKSAYPND